MQNNNRLSGIAVQLGSVVCLLLLLSLSSFAQVASDIEKNFTTHNDADLSGEYQVSGVMADSNTYTGTLKLTKWKTFTTLRGSVLQTFKMDYRFGDTKSNGVAVFDGHRLYYASGEGNRNNYYLLILSKLQLSKDVIASLDAYSQAADEASDKSSSKSFHYVEWKGKAPWYGYLDTDDKAFGYYFWSDGTWGHFATSGNGFPFNADTGHYSLVDLKENGESRKSGTSDAGGFTEHGRIVSEPAGENQTLTNLPYDREYWGTAIMTADPVTGDSILVAIMGGPKNATVGYFDVSGNKLVGVWTDLGSEGRGTEEWEVPDNALQKNPGLFK